MERNSEEFVGSYIHSYIVTSCVQVRVEASNLLDEIN